MRSFRSAIAAGCDLIECDVHLSSDSRLVVIHDHTLERTTNGTGLVRDFSAAELRKLDAGEGEKIPLLQEVIELVLGKVGLVIEIKQVPPLYPGLEDKLMNMLRQLGAVQECAVISFNHTSIHQLRKMEPSLQLGILEASRPMHPAKMLRDAGADVYSPHWGATTSRAYDTAAEVSMNAYQAYERFEPRNTTPAAWLFRIARNATLDHFRAQGRRDRLRRTIEHQPSPEGDPASQAEERIQYRALLAHVAGLPERQRDAISLRHSGLQFDEVGKLMGCSEDAAKMLYHRAVRALKDAVRKAEA